MTFAPIQNNLWALFSSVFWPAATGSVFWAFCNVLIDKNIHFLSLDTLYNSIVLLVISIYLTIEWLKNYPKQQKYRKCTFWIFDFLHLCSIVFVAITITENRELLINATYSFFLIISLGHWFGAWSSDDLIFKRLNSGLPSFAGAIVVFLGCYFKAPDWYLPLSYSLVLIIWLIMNNNDIKGLTSTKT